MPGYSQLKKLSQTLLKLGNEINLRAERGEKAVPVPIPDTIPDIDDSQDFVLGMPEKPKPPEPEPEENDGVMFFSNSINSPSEASSLDSVFTAGAGHVGYDSLSSDLQREFYDRIDAAATEFMLSGEDIDAVIKTSDSVNYNVYVIDTIKYTSFTKETYDSVQNEMLQAFLAYDYDHPAYYWINNSVWLESDHNSNLYLYLKAHNMNASKLPSYYVSISKRIHPLFLIVIRL
mgnify:CR=1 FL=1